MTIVIGFNFDSLAYIVSLTYNFVILTITNSICCMRYYQMSIYKKDAFMDDIKAHISSHKGQFTTNPTLKIVL